MNKTIVALYDDIVVARQVVEDLVNANFARSSISLITNDAHNQYSHFLDKDYVPRDDAVTADDGARFGSVVGAITGLLVGAAALTIPDLGLAIAVGPIVGAMTGLLVGAITGGIAGALVKSSVPEDEAPYYAEGIRRGGTLISIRTSDTLRVEDIMNRNGSTNIHERINLWRQQGWKGFDGQSIERKAADAPPVVTFSSASPATMKVMPIHHNVPPLTVTPVVEEDTPMNDLVTARSFPVMVTAAPTTDTVILTAPTPSELTVEPVLVVVENEDTTK